MEFSKMHRLSKKKLLNKKRGEQLLKARRNRMLSLQNGLVEEPIPARMPLQNKKKSQHEKKKERLLKWKRDHILPLQSVQVEEPVSAANKKNLRSKEKKKKKDDNDEYLFMQTSKLEKLIASMGSCKSCGGNGFKIGKVMGGNNDAAGSSHYDYSLECRSKDCGMKVSAPACEKVKLGGEEVFEIDAIFGMANSGGISYNGMSSIFTKFGLPIPSASQTRYISSSLVPKEKENRESVVNEH